MVTSLKNSKYFTNCICLQVSDCFYILLLLSMVCSNMQLKRDASWILLMKWVIPVFSYLRDLNLFFSVNTALNPEETESALEATSYFTEDVTTEGNTTLLPLPLSVGRSCSTDPCAANSDFLQGMDSWCQYVKIASVFEFAVFVAWWERSLELKLLSTHFMQDPSEAQLQTAEAEQCAFTSPSPTMIEIFHASLIVSLLVFVSFSVSFYVWPFLLFYLGYCPLNLFFCCSSISFCLRAGFLPALWVSRSVHGLCACIEHVYNADNHLSAPMCCFKYSEVVAAAPLSWHSHYD